MYAWHTENSMTIIKHLLLPIAIWLVAVSVIAAELPRAKPESVGLSSERLDRMGQVLRDKVDAGEIPGFVALVARHGKVAYLEAYGYRNPETKAPMARDSIFRMYSMTKSHYGVQWMDRLEYMRMLLPSFSGEKLLDQSALKSDSLLWMTSL